MMHTKPKKCLRRDASHDVLAHDRTQTQERERPAGIRRRFGGGEATNFRCRTSTDAYNQHCRRPLFCDHPNLFLHEQEMPINASVQGFTGEAAGIGKACEFGRPGGFSPVFALTHASVNHAFSARTCCRSVRGIRVDVAPSLDSPGCHVQRCGDQNAGIIANVRVDPRLCWSECCHPRQDTLSKSRSARDREFCAALTPLPQ